MHGIHFAHFHRKHAENLRKDAVLNAFEMRGQARQDAQEKFQFSFGHCFDDEFAVMAEKEKASGTSSTFACFEDHISVELGTQTCMQDLEAGQIVLEGVHESAHSVVSYFHVLLDHDCVALVAL